MSLKKKQIVGVVLALAFLSTIFAYGTGSYRAIREEWLFFTPAMISTHLEPYNEEEKAEIEKDLNVVRSICFSPQEVEENVNHQPLFLTTAGGPGARKSTILERFIGSHPEYTRAVYVDPDQRALKFMVHTYYAQSLNAFHAALTGNYLAIQRAAYEKWRPASNYITLTLLEEAFEAKRDIAYGATSTGAHVPVLFKKIHDAGYHITLLLCSCDDSLRKAAVEYRNEKQRFYQSTPEDALVKGALFPQRMSTYFENGDTLYFYWSDDLFSPERLAAVFQKGQIDVIDSDALNCFIAKYELDRNAFQVEGKILPAWDELVKMYQVRF